MPRRYQGDPVPRSLWNKDVPWIPNWFEVPAKIGAAAAAAGFSGRPSETKIGPDELIVNRRKNGKGFDIYKMGTDGDWHLAQPPKQMAGRKRSRTYTSEYVGNTRFRKRSMPRHQTRALTTRTSTGGRKVGTQPFAVANYVRVPRPLKRVKYDYTSGNSTLAWSTMAGISVPYLENDCLLNISRGTNVSEREGKSIKLMGIKVDGFVSATFAGSGSEGAGMTGFDFYIHYVMDKESRGQAPTAAAVWRSASPAANETGMPARRLDQDVRHNFKIKSVKFHVPFNTVSMGNTSLVRASGYAPIKAWIPWSDTIVYDSDSTSAITYTDVMAGNVAIFTSWSTPHYKSGTPSADEIKYDMHHTVRYVDVGC